MTCVVGIEDGSRVLIAGDSAGAANGTRTTRADEKVFLVDTVAFGFTNSFRMGQLLRYSLVLPDLPADREDLERWMSVDFINAVRKCLKRRGYARCSDDGEEGGTFLVGIGSQLFRVTSDYQVGRSLYGYDAIGCAEAVALGALHATSERSARFRAQRALEAAAEHSTGVSPPFNFIASPRLWVH